MKFEFLLAKRIISTKAYKSSISAPIIKIGIIAIALSIIVMLISISTGIGLQNEIRDKVSAFNGHIIISNFDSNNSDESHTPIDVDNDLLSKKFVDWFDECIESGIWTSEEGELVAELHAMAPVQIRDADSPEHTKDIKAELVTNGCNTSDMNPVLIFEGVGKKLKFDTDCDVVAGGNHGLNAAKQAKALYMKTNRVPYEVLKNKSELFLRNLAAHDNKDNTKLKYLPTKEDGAKLLVNLFNQKGISPDSDIAKEQLQLAYNLKARKLTESIKLAKKRIEEQRRGNQKWHDYNKKECKEISEKRSTDEQLHTTMPSGFLDIYKLLKRIVEDVKKRKYCVIWVHHRNPDALTSWNKREADELEFLYEILNLHRKKATEMRLEFRTLDPWMSDTKNNYETSA